MGGTVEQFFEDIERESREGQTLPVWRGELYLEFHRGTYTSHGSIKKGNRKCEILLRDVERLATLATLFKPESSSFVYPKATIDDCWEKVLLNQFHDVLPGSAIGMVYVDAEKLYSEVRKDCKAMLEDALAVLLSGAMPLSEDSPISHSSSLVAVNTTPFARRDIIKIPVGTAQSLLAEPAQTTVDGKHAYVLLETQENGMLAQPSALTAEHGPVSVSTNGSDHVILWSQSLRLTISEGRIVSLYDVKLKRELIASGNTGGLVIFEDRPNYWDAWDVEVHHLEKPTPLKFSGFRVVAEGPLRAAVQTQVKYGQSNIAVTISLDAFSTTLKENSRPLFNFDADVDWHEKHKILKFELPLDINNTVATYECQFGWVQRPTYKNTTLDAAKFEVCGHKFADFSEYGYGVAVLSESKYGYSCQGNVLRLSLLRAATAPDAEQDQGKHAFSWAVMPHVGSFLESAVAEAAYIFNSPLHLRAVPRGAPQLHASPILSRSPFWLEGDPNVFLETIKRGEDDDVASAHARKTVVLRLYEAYGGHGRVRLRIAPSVRVAAASLTNLLEDHKAELQMASGDGDDGADAAARVFGLDLDFRGFEVKTVKLVIAGDGHGAGVESDDSARSSSRDSWVSVREG